MVRRIWEHIRKRWNILDRRSLFPEWTSLRENTLFINGYFLPNHGFDIVGSFI